jgi:Protein of unknown function (DUF429)
MRCAVLLGDLAQHVPPEQLARDGSGLVAEAYLDAALRLWMPELWSAAPPESYKGTGELAQTRRQRIVEALLDRLGPTFRVTAGARQACVASDDSLDALVCSLLARAVDRGLTMPETEE